jgi:hypothetical protein
MATTTATIAISSSDMMSGQVVSLSNSTTLTKAGARSDIEETTGLAMKTLTAASSADIIDISDADFAGNACKLYIKNTSASTDQYVTIGIGGDEIGRLYGGDFMFVPYDSAASSDVTATPSTSEKVILEWMIFVG